MRWGDLTAKYGGKKMTDYMQMLMNITATMLTLVIVAGSVGTIIFIGLAIWNLINDHID